MNLLTKRTGAVAPGMGSADAQLLKPPHML